MQAKDKTDLELYAVSVRDAEISGELVAEAHGRPCAVWSVRIGLFVANDTEPSAKHSSATNTRLEALFLHFIRAATSFDINK